MKERCLSGSGYGGGVTQWLEARHELVKMEEGKREGEIKIKRGMGGGGHGGSVAVDDRCVG